MKNSFLQRIISSLVILTLVLSTLVLSAGAAPAGQTVAILLPAGEVDTYPLSVLRQLDYGDLVWVEFPVSQLATLRASGLAYWPVETTISFYDLRFDPLEGEPALPADLVSRPAGNELGLHLVQFDAPIRDAWLAELRAAGLVPLQYYPHHAYLVWGTPDQLSRLDGQSHLRWSGPFQPGYKPNPALASFGGRIENIAVTFYNDGATEATLDQLARLGTELVQAYPAQPDGALVTAIVALDAGRLADVARLPTVWALDYASPRPGLDDEVGAQIIAGNTPGGTPVTGYYTWLTSKGVDGGGITWADVDTGLNASHPDLTGRAVAFVSYPGAGAANADPDGHGSHTAGAIMGDGQGGTGITDPSGFYWGTGAAPEASLVVQNALMGTAWPPTGGWQVLSRDSLVNGAVGSSNSWYTGASGSQGYSSAARTHDIMARDGDWTTPATAEPIILVFSAGNAGDDCGAGPCYTSMTEPKEAKNMISVAASDNYPRTGSSINGIAYFSSRGPAQDGRMLPIVTAPGRNTASLNGSSGNNCGSPVAGPGSSYYNYCSGTSMAAPFVSGAAALIADWWDQEGWGTPSPAMVKALLVNGAADMAGGDNGWGTPNTNRPNWDQGWGMVHLDDTIRPDVPMLFEDQATILGQTGESWQRTWAVANPGQPAKISLVWSDAPGAIGANPALVNNLDLVVVNGNKTYRGNVFAGGWSADGGSADTLNNLENVFIDSASGALQITVLATNIAGDGVPANADLTDQDFSLVCTNCVERAGYTLAAVPDRLSVCAPDLVTSTIQVGEVISYPYPVALTTVGVPAGVSASLTPTSVVPSGLSLLTLDVGPTAADGTYALVVSGTAQMTDTQTAPIELLISSAPPVAPTLLAPADGAADQPTGGLDFTWSPLPQVGVYRFQLDSDPAFGAPLIDASGLTTATYTVDSGLDVASCYFWRAMGDNPCGPGGWADPFRFATVAIGVAFDDDLESGTANWSHQAAQGTDNWQLSTAQSHSPSHAWFVPDDPVITDSYLWTANSILVGPGSSLSFWHRHQFEGSSWDGSVIEISADGGSSWQDLGSHITANGYNGTLSVNYGNPLGGRQAWTGDLTTWTQVTVDLGAYQGQYILLRWRLGCDSSVSDAGWYIDDILVTAPLPTNPAPTLTAVDPASGSPYAATPVQVSGTGLVGTPHLRLGDTWLVSVTRISSTTVEATVPAGMAAGVYDLTLINGDCQQATLTDAFTVIGQCVTPTVSLSSDSPVDLGQPLHLTGQLLAGTPPLTYTWEFGGAGYGVGLDGLTPVYTYTASGSYTVTLTADNACGSGQASEPVVVNPLRIYLPLIVK